MAVVFGHSGYEYGYYTFFFHIPLFVFISGYLYKRDVKISWLESTRKKFRHLMGPYFFYMAVITLILMVYALKEGNPISEALDWKSLIWGGSQLNGAYGTFWFATFLFTVQILYDLLQRKVSSPWLLGLIILLMYGIAHWESLHYQKTFIPWNTDVALYGISFYALGNLFRKRKFLEDPFAIRRLKVGAVTYLIAFFLLYGTGLIRFGLDLKHRQYYFFGTVILTPLALTIIFVFLSIFLSRFKLSSKVLGSLGQASMSIMYLHVLVGIVLGKFIPVPWYLFLILGLVLPWVWNYALNMLTGFRALPKGKTITP